MTHFATLVLTTSGDDDEVTRLLKPYDENDEWFAEGSRWDWWVIGGRFTGLLTPDYEPWKDPENFETCWLCGGTGDRAAHRGEPRSPQHPSGCNGCEGTGEMLKHAPDWQPCDADRRPVAELQPDSWRFIPGSLVTPDGKWLEKGRAGWFGTTIPDEDGNEAKPEEAWRAVVDATLAQYPEAVAVVVDCHV